MKKLLPYIKILVIYIFVLALIGFVSGYLSTKQQIPWNSGRWTSSISDGGQAHIQNFRDYNDYYIVLGTYDNQRAYLAAYKKLPLLPLYTRNLIVTNETRDTTGIGFELRGKDVTLALTPPYTDIYTHDRNNNNELVLAPETMS